jgi:lipoate-protein ligase A
VEIVRRATGGRAILHADELTYSVAGPADEPVLRGGVLDVYQRLSAGLIEGLRWMGIEAETEPRAAQEHQAATAACFDQPSAHEVTVGGRKLVGSAQCRQGKWVLQHGSLPLGGDVAQIVDCLVFDTEEKRESLRKALRHRAVTAAQVTGAGFNLERSAEAVADGFSRSLNIRLAREDLTVWERVRAGQLRASRYSNEAWTRRR